MFLRNYWYAVAWDGEIKYVPFGSTLCGEPIVLYRRTNGTLSALEIAARTGCLLPYLRVTPAAWTLVPGNWSPAKNVAAAMAIRRCPAKKLPRNT